MTTGRITESVAFLPTCSLSWYTYKGKKHYYVTIGWLFWYVTTLKKFDWED